MVRYLKTIEFALALNVSSASIAMALKNEKLVREKDKTYDIENPINLLWINNMVAKGKEFDLSKVYKKQSDKMTMPETRGRKKKGYIKPPPIKKVTPIKKTPIVSKAVVEQQEEEPLPPEMTSVEKPPKKNTDTYVEKKRKLELKKLQNQIKIDDLKIKKIEGTLIPYEAVKTVFLYAVETIDNTYNQEVDALANIFIKRLDGTHGQFIELKETLSEKLIAIKEQAKEDLLQGIKGIQAEYQEVRGRGERK